MIDCNFIQFSVIIHVIFHFSGEGETLEGLVLLDTNLVIFGQSTIGIFDLRGQLIENRRLQLDGQIFTIRYILYYIDTVDGQIFTIRSGYQSQMVI